MQYSCDHKMFTDYSYMATTWQGQQIRWLFGLSAHYLVCLALCLHLSHSPCLPVCRSVCLSLARRQINWWQNWRKWMWYGNSFFFFYCSVCLTDSAVVIVACVSTDRRLAQRGRRTASGGGQRGMGAGWEGGVHLIKFALRRLFERQPGRWASS